MPIVEREREVAADVLEDDDIVRPSRTRATRATAPGRARESKAKAKLSKGPLAGLTILNPRPSEDAEPLGSLLRSSGAEVVDAPLLVIEPTAGPDARAALAAGWDLVIFPSRNSVRAAISLSADPPPWATAAILAVGPSTLETLHAAGLTHARAPDLGADSESLLSLQELTDIAGRAVLIPTAPGGRDLIAITLRARGAQVREAHVYKRKAQKPSVAALSQLREAQSPILIALSRGMVDILLSCRGDGFDPRSMPLLVVGERLKAEARQLGFVHIYAAAAADPPSLIEALIGEAKAH